MQLGSKLEDSQITTFLQESEGKWYSERRYYALPNGKIKDVKKIVSMRFLEQGSAELIDLAKLHELPEEATIRCGSYVEWSNIDLDTGDEGSKRWTVLGTLGTTMYFGRNFPVPRLVIAQYYFRDPKTIYLWTEENGSLFEEELKLIGKNYRTRQTVISRAGHQQMIAQYMEKLIQ
ncbi:phycobiliprotein lyase [Cylindrospermum sp. FACHB-282]|uniref:phycobiliprotein lyase n=1 Tax=Cylindrospermum sp. FACHB-282 TaxID=2692794 RepID=UPI001687DD55|nr:phycobiliprotein lyase [Cylindrospermum sp. FACHB-282]MBD2383882.1 phycobiliprotein lyase [Cylindrospermum sp. FACHB-282]